MARAVEHLSDEECLELLAGAVIGRVVLVQEHDIEVFPVNFLVHDGAILFRTAPGTKLEAIAHHPRVAFEVDAFGAKEAWSVIAWGAADRLAFDDEIVASGVTELVSWFPTDADNFVRITPTRLSGRRFRRADA
jgi:nitroimidazol reductase NimA-like FMN-containing flavoprotein (pyridoxamine 5'-phosphate oxidase superfamily)